MSECPKCGAELTVERSTMTGRTIYEYDCPSCGYSETEDAGTAVWKAMADAREAAEGPAPAVVLPNY